jgi:hypothetical protein
LRVSGKGANDDKEAPVYSGNNSFTGTGQASAQATNIDSLRPIDPVAEDAELNVVKIIVFTEARQIIVSFVGQQGTFNVPLERRTAAGLASSLMKRLAQEPA